VEDNADRQNKLRCDTEERIDECENTKPLMPPTAASRTVNGCPMAPINPPGSHPIAAPINEPTMPMTILSGDGSAIFSPGRAGHLYSGSVW
jgi:hypothetical protein